MGYKRKGEEAEAEENPYANSMCGVSIGMVRQMLELNMADIGLFFNIYFGGEGSYLLYMVNRLSG